MSALVSFSNLDRGMACVAANVLARVDEAGDNAPAARGTSVHKFLEAAFEHGPEKALAEMRVRGESAEVVQLCEAIDLAALPWASFDKLYVEAGFALNVFTGAVRFLGEHCTHETMRGKISPEETGGVLDLVGIDNATGIAYLYDYKTGALWVDPATSWQLAAGAVALAAHFRVTDVHAEFLHIKGGEVYRRSVDLDLLALDSARADLQRQALKVKAARAALPMPPPATMGKHCDYCPCKSYCPALFGQIQALVASPDAEVFGPLIMRRDDKWEVDLRNLTPEMLGQAHLKLANAEQAVEVARKALDLYNKQTPLPLGNGRVRRAVERGRDTKIDAEIAHKVIVAEAGTEVADAACPQTRETSKVLIEAALKPLGKGAKKRAAEVVEKVRAQGGVWRSEWTQLEEVEEKP